MRTFRQWLEAINGKYAKYFSSPESIQQILASKKILASSGGVLGPGIYAFLTPVNNYGRLTTFVYFDVSHLKILTGKPDDIPDPEWVQLNRMNPNMLNSTLAKKYGYDAKVDNNGVWIVVFPESANKIVPLQNIQ